MFILGKAGAALGYSADHAGANAQARLITCEEVTAAAEYLMSPLARNVTGQTITIDGGWTAQ